MPRPPTSPGSPPGPGGGTCAFARAEGAQLVVDVLVVPGASRSRVLGAHGDRIRVAVAEAPEGGRATAAVVELFATVLEVPPRTVTVRRGDRQRRKTLVVAVSDPASAEAVLRRLVAVVDSAASR